MADTAPDKRAKLVDELLNRKEFVELWVLNLVRDPRAVACSWERKLDHAAAVTATVTRPATAIPRSTRSVYSTEEAPSSSRSVW